MDRKSLLGTMQLMYSKASTREQFEEFVQGKGLPEIKALIEGNRFVGEAMLAAKQWVMERELESERKDFEAMLAASRLSAQAAANSARWTMWAAVAAAIGALGTMAGVLVPVFMSAPERSEPSRLAAPTQAAPTVEKSPQPAPAAASRP